MQQAPFLVEIYSNDLERIVECLSIEAVLALAEFIPSHQRVKVYRRLGGGKTELVFWSAED